MSIFNDLKFVTNAQYDEKDAIGRRYRRQDAIGTPYCITVDFQTLEDNTVTIRDRDTLAQERIAIGDIERIVLEKTDMRRLLEKLK
jgi:glycyl-tRNA synthetase